MCSVGDDFENESSKFASKKETLNLSNMKCNKCRESPPIIVLRHKDVYCKDCFLSATNHKFKAILGKSKLIRPNDKILISHEVGHPSTALAHLIRTNLDLNTSKKLRFEPVFVFMEDQYHLTVEEREKVVKEVVEEAGRFNFKMNLVSLANAIDGTHTLSDKLTLNASDQQRVFSNIAELTNETNRKEILHLLKRNALLAIAKQFSCKYIFTPELSVDIAANLLTNISLGRGSQVPVDTGFCDDRHGEIMILRPLRTFDMKEVALYNALHKIDPVSVQQPQVNNYSSVQTLTKQFIDGLQENYPATIATVVRTGDKLALDQSKVVGKCQLCQGVIVRDSNEITSNESTNFSKLVSTEKPDRNLSPKETYLCLTGKFNQQINNGFSKYCFSCSKLSNYLLE